jgi:DNA (cytosine-5)-methyltransferase 1
LSRATLADLADALGVPVSRLQDGRPLVLDAYCCQGGASRGYDLAGFNVVGVDLFQEHSQKRYPYPSFKGDAVAFILKFGHLFAFIHASPPCQHASAGTRTLRAKGKSPHLNLIPATREALKAVGVPYIIENVKGADLIDPVQLCGTSFELCAVDTDGTKLEMWRHRLFESNLPIEGTECDHGWFSPQVAGAYGGARRDKDEARNVRHGGYVPSIPVLQRLLKIDWMTQAAMFQALPPHYTLHFGLQVKQWLL